MAVAQTASIEIRNNQVRAVHWYREIKKRTTRKTRKLALILFIYIYVIFKSHIL